MPFPPFPENKVAWLAGKVLQANDAGKTSLFGPLDWLVLNSGGVGVGHTQLRLQELSFGLGHRDGFPAICWRWERVKGGHAYLFLREKNPDPC